VAAECTPYAAKLQRPAARGDFSLECHRDRS
jgi:hypothetical protein